jgi:hypothetical protein
MLKVTFTNLDTWKRFMTTAGVRFQRARNHYQSEMIVAFRYLAIDSMRQNATIRSNKFLQNTIQLRTPRLNAPVAVGEVFTAPRERFTGWVEQERGGPARVRKNRETTAGRMGNKKRHIPPRFRFTAGKKIPDSHSEGILGQNNAVGLVRAMSRRSGGKPFMIHERQRNWNHAPGLYRFIGGELKLLQRTYSKHKPTRTQWMFRAIQTLSSHSNPQLVWNRSVQWVFGG